MVDKFESRGPIEATAVREGYPLELNIITTAEPVADISEDSFAGTRLDPRRAVMEALGDILVAQLPAHVLDPADTQISTGDN